MKIESVLVIITLFCFLSISIHPCVGASLANFGFDMRGTINLVLSPASIVVGNVTVNLEGVNSSSLSNTSYVYLMEDLRDYYIGKDVLVKGNYAYFDLNGAYNQVSINEMISRQISDLMAAQRHIIPKGDIMSSLSSYRA